MKNILSGTNHEVLAQLAWSNVLLAFDYDGTLAPIVADPNRAAMRFATRRLLRQAALLYPCVVISGRAQRDVARHVRGVSLAEIIGNHGLEPWQAKDRFKSEVARWRPILEAGLASQRGVVLEDKVFSMAVHYRRSRTKKKARAAILELARTLGDVRIVGGKQVINLLASEAPHKGNALESAQRRRGCDTAIYVGDDETDEDVFALDCPGRLLTIRVGARRDSLASFCLTGQKDVDRLLRTLIELRRSCHWPLQVAQ